MVIVHFRTFGRESRSFRREFFIQVIHFGWCGIIPPAAPLCDGPKRAPSRGDHNGERAVAWRCVWPGALPPFCALAAWRSAEAHGGVHFSYALAAWGSVEAHDSTAPCCFAGRMIAAARAQWPGANARLGFWAPFLGLSGRAARRAARAPLRTAWALRGVAPSKVPVFSSPAPLRPWQGPGRFRKRAATKAQF